MAWEVEAAAVLVEGDVAGRPAFFLPPLLLICFLSVSYTDYTMTGVVVRIDGVWSSFSLYASSETTPFFHFNMPILSTQPKKQNDTTSNSIIHSNEPIFA